MNTNQSDDFESVFEDINNFLLNYGWMVGPRIQGGELEHLRALCMQARNSPPDDQSRSLIERELNSSLLNITFHPTYRAHYACKAMRTAHVLRFSHFIERAILN